MKQIKFEKQLSLYFHVYVYYNNKESYIQEILWLYAKDDFMHLNNFSCILLASHYIFKMLAMTGFIY